MTMLTNRAGAPIVASINKSTPIDAFPFKPGGLPFALYTGIGGDIELRLGGQPTLTRSFVSLGPGSVFVADVVEVISYSGTGLQALY